ncbi:hypothetical protein COLO4_37728 [Corchorus olitorius]|uniref:Uncharacterized protein n=1 Tax=Corchorus olitorius TaxID=93759 RepID=A0A1R3FZU5_9ROSI|nr:hypothetical protein COLO4_37728 [Corchorus olitorius]
MVAGEEIVQRFRLGKPISILYLWLLLRQFSLHQRD